MILSRCHYLAFQRGRKDKEMVSLGNLTSNQSSASLGRTGLVNQGEPLSFQPELSWELPRLDLP